MAQTAARIKMRRKCLRRGNGRALRLGLKNRACMPPERNGSFYNLSRGLRNGLRAELLNFRLVGAVRRGNSGDRGGFDAAPAASQKRADGHGQRQSQQGTIAQQRQWAQAFAGAKASAI